jgi:hypothetical protein
MVTSDIFHLDRSNGERNCYTKCFGRELTETALLSALMQLLVTAFQHKEPQIYPFPANIM